MTIQFVQPLDTKQIKSEVAQRIVEAQRNYDFYLTLLSIVRKFEGKQITKRIANALQKTLPDHTIYYDADFSMYHIRIGGNGIEWDSRPSFLLGYKSSQRIVSEDFFVEYNQWAYLEKERKEKYIESEGHIESLVEQWNKALKTLQKVHSDAAKWGSTIEYTFDLPIRR